MPKTKQTKAFTLVEIVVAVSIFMLILGISMRSYLNLIDGQNQANLNRLAISEVKNIFQILENENHQKSLLYTDAINQTSLNLISDDLLQKVSFEFENQTLFQTYSNRPNTRSRFEKTKEPMHSTNLEIENLLIDEQVIIQENQPDSESMLLYVYFSSKEHYIGFIERLNKFLIKYSHSK